MSQGSGTWQPCTGKPNGVSVAPLYSGGARSWLQAAVAITGRYLLGLLPMGGVPFTTADDRQDGGRHGGFQPQRLTGPPVRAHQCCMVAGPRSLDSGHCELASLNCVAVVEPDCSAA